MLPFILQKRLFVILTLVFVAFAVIGTLSHEGGHYLMARYYGFNKVRIHYAATTYGDFQDNDTLKAIYSRNKYAIEHDWPYAEEQRYKELKEKLNHELFYMTMAGPMQTMMTGSLGFILILIFGVSFRSTNQLKAWQWLFVFVALFWMRQAFNLVTSLVVYISKGHFGHGDETSLYRYIGWPPVMGYLLTGTIAIIILLIIVFGYIPVKQRFTLLAAGLVGGVGGSILWLCLVGPLLMP
jgi:hypothetical protein